ncbi:MAG: flavoprotein [Candidatus Omnitrophota bacterium]|jgi:phosphopantothenoylcysteine decarboxylase/phosphopantothenate--cysteine ligase
MMGNKHVIVGVTAGIAIYKACEVVRQLKNLKLSVTVVMTKESEEFIKPALFRTLSGNKVYQGLFDDPQTWEIEHVSLAEQAAGVVIVPATANIIGKLASGICDDLLTCVVSATKAPVLICPAMNENMYTNRIVQDNIKKLKSVGYRFVEPRIGRLACGKTGIGCLAEVETIVKSLQKLI